MSQFLFSTSWCLPLYGLIAAILTLPWAIGIIRRTGPRPAAYLNLFASILAFIHCVFIFIDTWNREPKTFSFVWFSAANFDLSFDLDISPITIGASVLITGLSLLAQVYALGYMEKDWAMARFFALMGFLKRH